MTMTIIILISKHLFQMLLNSMRGTDGPLNNFVGLPIWLIIIAMVVVTMMMVVVVVVIKLRSAKIRINGVKAVARPVGSHDMETISNDSNSYEMVVEKNIVAITTSSQSSSFIINIIITFTSIVINDLFIIGWVRFKSPSAAAEKKKLSLLASPATFWCQVSNGVQREMTWKL